LSHYYQGKRKLSSVHSFLSSLLFPFSLFPLLLWLPFSTL
jgi:hypothetical protein